MRVALLTDSDVFAGTERHILDLAVELRALGNEPMLVCPGAGMLAKRGRAEGLQVVGMEKRRTVDPGVVTRLAKLWRNGDCTVMHAHNGRMELHAALARTMTRRGALVATQHFLNPARTTYRGLRRFAGQAAHGLLSRLVRRYVAISQAVGDAMLSRRETPSTKLRVVLNGIRDPRKQNIAPSLRTREKMGIADHVPLVVCLARLEPEKGLGILLDAMEIVARTLPEAICVIAGEGSLANSLRKRLADASTLCPVKLLGFVDDPLSLLAAADLCVLPSVAEPFGLSLVEAMALGVPVVSTRAGGPLEIVQEGRSGLLSIPNDARSLADNIVSVLGNEVRRAEMGKAARGEFLARFTARRMAEQMMSVYQEAAM
ncbi:MAG: glycosyltransferase family 4 protein [Rhodospirillales bacterium]|nr:glycosyltransferase family 4 protein [Acetobacter sp.]